MTKINALIENKILKNVNKDNYFIWKKANLLCEANLFFLVFLLFFIAPAHWADFQKHPLLVIGDILTITGLMVSILFIRKGNVFSAGICTVIAFMIIPLLHNFIGDWLFPINVDITRFFETLVMICFLFILIITYSINKWQIIVAMLFSVPIVLGHFFVLRNVIGLDIPYAYLLYILFPVAIGIIAFANLRLVNDAIESLIKSKNQMAEWNRSLEEVVRQRTKELVESNNKLESMSNTDGLTGIGNRRYFDNALATEWSRAQRNDSHVALIIGDVDWFKSYNDIYGHLAGDECLRLVANVFKNNARRESDFVARYGGEEFAAIFPVMTSDQAISFAEMLTENLRELKLPHSGSQFGYVTISLGIAVVIPMADKSVEELLRAADDALYVAKKMGRNQYVLWNNENLTARNM